MTSLAETLLAVTVRLGSSTISNQIAVPKRTIDRWMAALRSADVSAWPADAVLHVAQLEFEQWGTTAVADAFRPHVANSAAVDKHATNTGDIAQTMSLIMRAHDHAHALLAEMAHDIADGVIDAQEARRMIPLIDVVQEHATKQGRELGNLRASLVRQLSSG